MKLTPADIPAQIRRMGRDAAAAGKTDCPFAEKSNAAKLWSEGYYERKAEGIEQPSSLGKEAGTEGARAQTIGQGEIYIQSAGQQKAERSVE